MWLPVILLAAACLATGLLPGQDALDLGDRVGPVLLFLVAMTGLAELAQRAQVFDVAAVAAARLGRGRTPLLFLALAVIGCATTVLLSLDTTALLFTPVVLSLAQQLGLPPLPFALLAVWTANTASLLLPVSNLTNLLAANRLGLQTSEYVRRTAPAALAAAVVTVAVLGLWQRRSLRGRYPAPAALRPDDPALCWAAGGACLLLVPLLAVGLSASTSSVVAAAAAVAAFAVRRPAALQLRLLPWRLTLLVSGLFLVVAALGAHGLDRLLGQATGGPLRTAAVTAAAANLVNNLPAYLALERVVPHAQLPVVLVAVDVGPLVLPWASVATLLWADRCRAAGVAVPWRSLVLGGAVLVPLLLLACVPLVA